MDHPNIYTVCIGIFTETFVPVNKDRFMPVMINFTFVKWHFSFNGTTHLTCYGAESVVEEKNKKKRRKKLRALKNFIDNPLTKTAPPPPIMVITGILKL